jgi:hypothetical protein
MEQSRGEDGRVLIERLAELLVQSWLKTYGNMCRHDPNVLEFEDHGFTFLFDQSSGQTAEAEDRLVAALGTSRRPSKGRDASRMRGFLGGRIEIAGKGLFDKGHVMAHASGGGLDVNLFPQRPQLNRGRSAQGRVYRRMERYAASNPGTFVFSRFLYSDPTWVPAELEYGVLRRDGELWIEQFAN